MTSWLAGAAAAVVRAWTWLYTLPLTPEVRRARRAEINSDSWELAHDPTRPHGSGRYAAAVLFRAALGVADDLLWVGEELPASCCTVAGWIARPAALAFIATVTLALLATGPVVEPAKILRVNVTSSGWLVVGGDRSRVTIVPALSLSVTNLADRTLDAVQVNAVFADIGSPSGLRQSGLGQAFYWTLDPVGLRPRATSPIVLLRPRQAWLDAPPVTGPLDGPLRFPNSSVRLFVKYHGYWTLLGEYPIPTQLITL